VFFLCRKTKENSRQPAAITGLKRWFSLTMAFLQGEQYKEKEVEWASTSFNR
jgi:hypothetical protein